MENAYEDAHYKMENELFNIFIYPLYFPIIQH